MKNYIKKMHRSNFAHSSQRGFSLLEVLISMVIGLFLLVGITTSYLSSKKASLNRDAVSILEDNGRAALELLTESLEHTGYRSNQLLLVENPFITEASVFGAACANGNANYPALANINKNQINGSGDTIGVIYMGDSTMNVDCTGTALIPACQAGVTEDTSDPQIFNTFYIENNELLCAGSLDTTQVMAEGVENMQILYGMDTDGDSNVEKYVDADDVGDDWGMVSSLQIAILVRAPQETKPVSEDLSYSLLDTEVDSPDDRYERAVFSTSINLRNL